MVCGLQEESEALYRSLVRRSPDAILVLGADDVVRYASPSAERVLGYPAEELVGERFPGRLGDAGSGSGGASGASEPAKVEMLHADGSWRRLEAIGVDLPGERGDGGKAYYVREPRSADGAEAELAEQAFQDGLTGLANRRLFMNRLEHALASGARRPGPVHVLFLDVDDFKAINDGYGHAAGDRVLGMVAQRVRSAVRPQDTVARIGGDEFCVLLEDAPDAADVANVAERIGTALKQPVSWAGHTLFVTVSIGIASSAPDLGTAEGLLGAADRAMYRAKRGGKARFAVVEEGLPAETIRRLRLGNDLRGAIERGELRVYYQPEYLLETDEIMGMEALVRWEHPERGLILPDEFVVLAEEDGMIVPMGQWVLKEACRQAKGWQEARADGPGLSVSVNLSARQFRQPALAQTVGAVLRETGLPPSSLILEVTESFLVDDEHALGALNGLKALGVRIAVDDFGTGYSALSYLDKFPIDFLKIDRSFVERLGGGEGGARAIVPLLVNLTRELGMRTIAEGVETEGQLEELRGMRCEVAQGYYFSEPLPEAEARALVAGAGAA